MKYLTYIRPTQEFERLVLELYGSSASSLGLHCTLLRFDMDNHNESGLIKCLSGVMTDMFSISLSEFDIFDKESFVVKISFNDNLHSLHKQIVERVRAYNGYTAEFDQMLEKHCLGNYLDSYHPHITFSRGKNNPDTFSFEKEMFIDKFYLARKENCAWEEVSCFKLCRK